MQKGKLYSNQGSITAVTVLIVASAAVWFALLLVISSNHLQNTEYQIAKEQSRYLAQSCWNMAIENILEETALTSGSIDLRPSEYGNASALWNKNHEGMIHLQVNSQFQRSKSRWEGTLFLLCSQWPIPELYLEDIYFCSEKGPAVRAGQRNQLVLLAKEDSLSLNRPLDVQWLGIYPAADAPLTVIIPENVQVMAEEAYINGNLVVLGKLQANTLAVQGQLEGKERIVSTQCFVGGEIPWPTNSSRRLFLLEKKI